MRFMHLGWFYYVFSFKNKGQKLDVVKIKRKIEKQNEKLKDKT